MDTMCPGSRDSIRSVRWEDVLPRSDHSGLILLLGMMGGLAAGFVLVRKRAASSGLPDLALWQQALAKSHGTVNAGFLCGRVQARFNKLFADRPRFSNPALRMHLEKNILPGLALYQVLREELEDKEAALRVVDDLFAARALTGPAARQARLLKLLPDPFSVFRRYLNATLKRQYPAEAWTFEPVENSDRVVAFNASRCFYLDVLSAYGAPELTPSFCRLDDLLMERFPYFAWKPTTTLGRGGPCCDFRYERITLSQPSLNELVIEDIVLDE